MKRKDQKMESSEDVGVPTSVDANATRRQLDDFLGDVSAPVVHPSAVPSSSSPPRPVGGVAPGFSGPTVLPPVRLEGPAGAELLEDYKAWLAAKQHKKEAQFMERLPHARYLESLHQDVTAEASLAQTHLEDVGDRADLPDDEREEIMRCLRLAFEEMLLAQQLRAQALRGLHNAEAMEAQIASVRAAVSEAATAAAQGRCVARSELHNALLILGENSHARLSHHLHRVSSHQHGATRRGSTQRAPDPPPLGWAEFVRAAVAFCAEAAEADVAEGATLSASDTPATACAWRVLRAARVYHGFCRLPHDETGCILGAQLRHGCAELFMELEGGSLDIDTGKRGIRYVQEMAADRHVSWPEFVAFLHQGQGPGPGPGQEEGGSEDTAEQAGHGDKQQQGHGPGQQLVKRGGRKARGGAAPSASTHSTVNDMGDAKGDRLKIAAEDAFVVEHGYSWDYVLVFPNLTERDMLRRTDFQQKQAPELVTLKLLGAGLDAVLYRSTDKEAVYCLVRAPLERLKREAERIGHKMLLDKQRLFEAAKNPNKHFADADWRREEEERTGERVRLDPIILPQRHRHDRRSSSMRHFDPYAAYAHIHDTFKGDDEPELLALYQTYPLRSEPVDVGPAECVFSGSERIKLILSLIQAPSKPDNGAGVDLKTLATQQCILAHFPLHHEAERVALHKKWITWCATPGNQPIDDIRRYLGEKIALYFAWLGHYTTWLMLAAVPGVATYVYGRVTGEHSDNHMVAPYAVLVMLWSTLYIEGWKRRNARISMQWGMTGFEGKEQPRPQFLNNPKCEMIKSPIHGRDELFFSPVLQFRRVLLSIGIICTFGAISIAVCCGLFYFSLLTRDASSGGWADHFTVSGSDFWMELGEPVSGTANSYNFGPLIATLANAMQILVLNEVIIVIAVALNNYENHKTETQYEDGLIAKVFVFQFVNSFFSLFYVAFAKGRFSLFGKQDRCTDDNCMKDLSSQLQIIFLVRIVLGNLGEVVVPWLKGKLRALVSRHRGNVVVDLEAVWSTSAAEKQFPLEKYDRPGRGLFIDYAEIIVQFGYVTLFVSAYPLAPVLAVLNNYAEIRVDAVKLLDVHRRPDPQGAEDIGMWLSILAIMATAAVITNGLIICFTASLLVKDLGLENYKMWLFIGIEHTVLLIKYLLSLVILDEEPAVTQQLERQDYLVRTIMDHEYYGGEDDNDAEARTEADKLVVHSTEFEATTRHKFDAAR
eukprot:g4704.t1